MGKNQLRMVKFAIKYPGWHSYGTDRATISALDSLVEMGIFEVNAYRQFRLKTPRDSTAEVSLTTMIDNNAKLLSDVLSRVESGLLKTPYDFEKYVKSLFPGGYAFQKEDRGNYVPDTLLFTVELVGIVLANVDYTDLLRHYQQKVEEGVSC